MKRHLFTKLGAILLIVALLLTAAACGKPAAPADEPTTAETPEETEAPVSGAAPSLLGSTLGSTLSDELTMFVKLDGIEGDCKNSQFDRQIDAIDFSFASQNSENGDSSFAPFVFKHKVDKATPNIQRSCMTGVRIRTGVLSVCRSVAGRQAVVFTVKLEGITVTKATVEYDEASGAMIETVELTVTKETWTVTSSGLDNAEAGSTEASFDQTKKC